MQQTENPCELDGTCDHTDPLDEVGIGEPHSIEETEEPEPVTEIGETPSVVVREQLPATGPDAVVALLLIASMAIVAGVGVVRRTRTDDDPVHTAPHAPV